MFDDRPWTAASSPPTRQQAADCSRELNAPEHNPLYRTLQALAAPVEWAVVSRAPDSLPGRLNVTLTLRRAQAVRHLELAVGGSARVEEVWLEFELWFRHPKRINPAAHH